MAERAVSALVAFLVALFGWAPLPVDEGSSPGRVVIPIESRSGGGSLPAVTSARGDDPPLVVIDPGHGGRDPGAPAPLAGLQEKDVTLALARVIRDEIARSGRVRVALTREGDRFIPLEGRYEVARRLGADLFISLHADAAPSGEGARGATIYTLSEVASDREAALLAQRENAADTVGGAAMSDDTNVNRILIDLAQRESMEVSTRFALLLRREAGDAFPFHPDWRRFAAFIVLKAPDIPSVLFEAGYLSNPQDVAYLTSQQGRAEIAAGLRRAVEAHFARRFLSGERREPVDIDRGSR